VKTILTAALALAALSSAALADGAVELTDSQMDQITAGAKGDAFGVNASGRGSNRVATNASKFQDVFVFGRRGQPEAK
jgi:hypothetical protein